MSFNWYKIPLKYKLLSPLYIGYRNLGMIDITRYYVPSRNFWGTVTKQLTENYFFKDNYNSNNYIYSARS